MKNRNVGLLLLLATTEALGATDLYTGLTLIDPRNETRTSNAYLLVADGRIVATGTGAPPAAPKADRIHDFTGRYALPGFIDAHGHITTGPQKVEVRDGSPVILQDSSDEVSVHYGRMALAFGVTTVRNPAGDPVANARYDAMVASGAWLGPEAFHAGAVIEPPPFGGNAFVYPRSAEEWDAEATRQAKLGMKYFKLYTDLTEQELATGIRVAHRHGLKAIAHLNAVSWTRAAQLGIDGIEHALPTSPDLLEPPQRAQFLAERGPNSKFMYRWFELADYDGPLMREMIATIVRNKVTLNMTLNVNDIIYHWDNPERAIPSEFRKYEHAETLQSTLATLPISMTGWSVDDYARAQAVMSKVLKLTKILHEAGAPMMIGTDGHGGGPYYARELALHSQAGIPAWEVLRMATSDTADILGIGNRTGRIEPGYEADIVFLAGDPLADINNAGRVYGVLNNGQLHLHTALTQGIE